MGDFTDCLKTAQCAPLKHHYDECAERVQKQEEENGKAEEDCVEECKLLPYDLCNASAGGLSVTEQPKNRAMQSQIRTITDLRNNSLPHDALCKPVRGTQAVQAAAVDDIDANEPWSWRSQDEPAEHCMPSSEEVVESDVMCTACKYTVLFRRCRSGRFPSIRSVDG